MRKETKRRREEVSIRDYYLLSKQKALGLPLRNISKLKME